MTNALSYREAAEAIRRRAAECVARCEAGLQYGLSHAQRAWGSEATEEGIAAAAESPPAFVVFRYDGTVQEVLPDTHVLQYSNPLPHPGRGYGVGFDLVNGGRVFAYLRVQRGGWHSDAVALCQLAPDEQHAARVSDLRVYEVRKRGSVFSLVERRDLLLPGVR